MNPSQSVAIIGFSSWTLPYAKASKADEIWTMNHHYMLDLENQRKGEPSVFPKPITRLFELHRPEWFLRKEDTASKAYWEWLRKPQPFPIYTQQEMNEVPASIEFPLEDVSEALLGHRLRFGERAEEYYTSSVAYMLALAIYENIPKIEIYGVEMASDTEYRWQRPGAEFWIGLAIGRGITVQLHPDSHLCNSWLYAYEAVPHIQSTRLVDLKTYYTAKFEDAAKREQELVRAFNAGQIKDYDAPMDATAWKGIYHGARVMCDTLLSNHDTFVSHQNLEDETDNYRELLEKSKGETNDFHARFVLLTERKEKKQAQEFWQKYLNARAMMYAYSGAYQVIELLMRECRLERTNPDLHMIIKEK